ncbi:glycoside hydrolase family 17 protein [Conidiobolus coronatus NRRL 28638]|uniref:glucan endo-1,3-beta-D-glucosidase n=1 Tax=Conidiobolus coronatus (strain ATCC 28846 / CBS 209.66 / NRRL 28638) TaxID=796925 RepID=A0A137NWF1_CONC2|nr:glycoside hydrolase family 17 protein [Conidiobolus coronatus NRRL 28638]|eukprot:KXN66981.1 glycoside hydrolase family 17 protein [Conidiobolus coronatus NRRL 28638]
MQLITVLSAFIAGIVSIPQAQEYQVQQARPFSGVTYTPYRPGSCGTPEQVASDVKNLAQYTKEIRLYSADCDQIDNVLNAIVSQGLDLQVSLGIWTRGSADRFQTELSSVGKALGNEKFRPLITRVAVGNEDLSNNVSIGTLGSNLKAAQDALKEKYKVKVGLVEVPQKYMDNAQNPAIASADFLGNNIQPYFNGFLTSAVSTQQAIPAVSEYLTKVASYFPEKEIIVTELGFPTAGSPSKDYGVCSAEAQYEFLRAARCLLKGYKVFAFEAYDSTFKNDKSYGGVEENFGILNRDGSLKAGTKQDYFQC